MDFVRENRVFCNDMRANRIIITIIIIVIYSELRHRNDEIGSDYAADRLVEIDFSPPYQLDETTPQFRLP